MKLFNQKKKVSVNDTMDVFEFRIQALKDAGIFHQMAEHFENHFFESKQISKKAHKLGK